MRELLTLRLNACDKCRTAIEDNVALMADDDRLTDAQIAWLLDKIGSLHLDHARVQ